MLHVMDLCINYAVVKRHNKLLYHLRLGRYDTTHWKTLSPCLVNLFVMLIKLGQHLTYNDVVVNSRSYAF